MKYEIGDDGTTLTLIADEEDRQVLRQIKAEPESEFDSDSTMCDLLEEMLCNSELEWVEPHETGDLTDAPMLGIRNQDGVVVHRWGFMMYQIISVQQRLLDTGKAVFVGGPLE